MDRVPGPLLRATHGAGPLTHMPIVAGSTYDILRDVFEQAYREANSESPDAELDLQGSLLLYGGIIRFGGLQTRSHVRRWTSQVRQSRTLTSFSGGLRHSILRRCSFTIVAASLALAGALSLRWHERYEWLLRERLQPSFAWLRTESLPGAGTEERTAGPRPRASSAAPRVVLGSGGASPASSASSWSAVQTSVWECACFGGWCTRYP